MKQEMNSRNRRNKIAIYSFVLLLIGLGLGWTVQKRDKLLDDCNEISYSGSGNLSNPDKIKFEFTDVYTNAFYSFTLSSVHGSFTVGTIPASRYNITIYHPISTFSVQVGGEIVSGSSSDGVSVSVENVKTGGCDVITGVFDN